MVPLFCCGTTEIVKTVVGLEIWDTDWSTAHAHAHAPVRRLITPRWQCDITTIVRLSLLSTYLVTVVCDTVSFRLISRRVQARCTYLFVLLLLSGNFTSDKMSVDMAEEGQVTKTIIPTWTDLRLWCLTRSILTIFGPRISTLSRSTLSWLRWSLLTFSYLFHSIYN